jgi:hypothetical protein
MLYYFLEGLRWEARKGAKASAVVWIEGCDSDGEASGHLLPKASILISTAHSLDTMEITTQSLATYSFGNIKKFQSIGADVVDPTTSIGT